MPSFCLVDASYAIMSILLENNNSNLRQRKPHFTYKNCYLIQDKLVEMRNNQRNDKFCTL